MALVASQSFTRRIEVASLLILRSLETPLSYYELDATGILHAQIKGVDQTKELIREDYRMLLEFLENKKVKTLVNATGLRKINKDHHEMLEEQIRNTSLAIAVVSSSVVGNLVIKVFLSLKKPPVPIKIFSSKAKALSWLRDLEE